MIACPGDIGGVRGGADGLAAHGSGVGRPVSPRVPAGRRRAGTVYLGAASTGEPVAVKLLHPHLVGNDEARTRFVREMQIAERVAPFCTAQVLDSGVVDGRPYIASEFVDGPSLQESVRETGPRGGRRWNGWRSTP